MKEIHRIQIRLYMDNWLALNNRLSTLLSCILLFALNNLLFSQTNTLKKAEYYKVSEVRIFINDPSEITDLRKQGLSFEYIK
jgi:hypothetical protein